MEKPLVSICIPTYNRCEQLKQAVEAIIPQPEFIDGRVEIVISDNASEDNTEAVGLEYAQKYENILYYRNSENVRDRNFPIVLGRANGILRKLNNDTFILNDDSLGILCKLAEEYAENKPYIFMSNRKEKSHVEQSMDFRTFVVTEGVRLTWIGAFTIWGSECVNITDDFAGCELCLWQVRKIYELAYKKNHAVVCDKKIGASLSPPKKDISYGLYQVFHLNFMKLTRQYVENNALNNDDIEKIERDLLYDFFTEWIIKWECNTTNFQFSETENLKKAVFDYYRNKPYWAGYQKFYRNRYWKMRIYIVIRKFLERK